MRWSLPLILSLLPLAGLAGKSNLHSRRCKQKSLLKPNTTTTKASPANKYRIDDEYVGDSFLNDWIFWTAGDPTSGRVIYQSKEYAMKNNLAFVKNNILTLAVDDKTWGGEGFMRSSVRITSPKQYNGGLFIANIRAMPYGCTVWPALWTVGSNWPYNGEVDIIEGVNNQETNLMSLHTGPGCSMPQGDCNALLNGNSGCGASDTSPQSYGAGLNNANGGVFALLWTNAAITIWRFPRSSIPQDITSKNPDPTQWGPPATKFPSSPSCDIASHFSGHNMVLDITICGPFAGGQYPSSGCPGTCEQAVADPRYYENAKWIIESIIVYQPV